MEIKPLIFTYNFDHLKTLRGLDAIKFIHPDIELNCVAQKHRPLAQPQYKRPTDPPQLSSYDAMRCSLNKTTSWYVVDHDNVDAIARIVREKGLNFAIILGARILKEDVIDLFPNGVLNIHPGYLPGNRGLDNMYWAIELGIPQACTAHLIDKNIDMGRTVARAVLNEVPSNLSDLAIDMMDCQINCLQRALTYLKHIKSPSDLQPVPKSPYRSYYPHDIDDNFKAKYQEYRSNYESIRMRYLMEQV